MTRFLTLFLTLGLLAMPTLGWADTRTANKAERADIRNIFNLINHVSIRQATSRNKQSFMNLLELKEDAYEESNALGNPGTDIPLPNIPMPN